MMNYSHNSQKKLRRSRRLPYLFQKPPKIEKKTRKIILTQKVPEAPHSAMCQCVPRSPMVFCQTVQATPPKVCPCTLKWKKRPRLGNHWNQSYFVLILVQVVCVEVRIDLKWWISHRELIEKGRKERLTFFWSYNGLYFYGVWLVRDQKCRAQHVQLEKIIAENSQFQSHKKYALTLWAKYMEFVVDISMRFLVQNILLNYIFDLIMDFNDLCH